MVQYNIQISLSLCILKYVYPNDAQDKTIYWKSSNPSILKVDGSGKITGVAVGTATITAFYKELNDSIEIEVLSNKATSFKDIVLCLVLIIGNITVFYYKKRKR